MHTETAWTSAGWQARLIVRWLEKRLTESAPAKLRDAPGEDRLKVSRVRLEPRNQRVFVIAHTPPVRE